MMISTRGRYALRVMIDLAEHNNSGYIPLKEISARQEISQKYMETIMVELSKNDFVDGLHGKGGGYRLNRAPEAYKVGDILRVTEGTLAPVACLESGTEPCERAAECRTLSMWNELGRLITDYLDGITIADLAKQEIVDNYVI